MNPVRKILYAALCAALASFAGCGGGHRHGLECEEGYEQCEDGCYDFQNDPLHCGGCETVCAADQQCNAGACMPGVTPGDDDDDGPLGDADDDDPRTGGGDANDGGDVGDLDGGDVADLDGGDVGYVGELDAGSGLDGSAGEDARTDADAEAGAVGDTGTGGDANIDGAIEEDGGIDMDGGVQLPDGAVVLSDGAILLPDGAVVAPDGAALSDDSGIELDGGVPLPDGAVVLPDGEIVLPDGASVGPDGTIIGEEDGGDAGDTDALVPPPVLCSGPGSPADCICGLGQIKCVDTCIDPNASSDDCGGCGIQCPINQHCSAGSCVNICDEDAVPPFFLCDDACNNFQSDHENCGWCGNECEEAAVCLNGFCLGQAVGHAIVIGHDMSSAAAIASANMNTIVGNAVFLTRRSPVRVLIYDEFTNANARAGVTSAIVTAAGRLGRAYVPIAAERTLVTSQLNAADVFVIEAQHAATDLELQDLGTMWSAALHQFLRFGGVIVLFDAGGNNGGTYQILQSAVRTHLDTSVEAVFTAVARDDSLDRPIINLVAPGDGVSTGVSTQYQSEPETAGFVEPVTGTVVLRDPVSTLPVVVHQTYVYVP